MEQKVEGMTGVKSCELVRPHTRLHCMGFNLINDQDAAESLMGLSGGWVLKFTLHYQTFTSCNDS